MNEIETLKKIIDDFCAIEGNEKIKPSLIIQTSFGGNKAYAVIACNVGKSYYHQPADDLPENLARLKEWETKTRTEQIAERIAEARATLAQLENEGAP